MKTTKCLLIIDHEDNKQVVFLDDMLGNQQTIIIEELYDENGEELIYCGEAESFYGWAERCKLTVKSFLMRFDESTFRQILRIKENGGEPLITVNISVDRIVGTEVKMAAQKVVECVRSFTI